MKSSTLPLTSPWLSSGFVNHCSLCFAKQIPSEVGLQQDDFSDEKSVLTVLSEKLQYLCFSQVPAGSDCSLSYLYCFCRFSWSISTVLPTVGLQVTREQITPLTGLYCFISFSLLVSTVLHFTAFGKFQRDQFTLFHTYTASVASSYWFLQSFTSLTFGKFQQARLPLLRFHTASVV